MSSKNLYLATALACTTACMFGYGTGYIGGVLALPSFTHYFALDALPPKSHAAAESFTISLWLLGALLGVLAANPVCSHLGRQKALTLCATTYTLSAILQSAPPAHSLMVFNAGRLLNGLGVGVGTLATPIYIAEIATPRVKGMLLAAWQVSMQAAALVGFWGAYVAHMLIGDGVHWQWRLPVLFQVVFGAILVVASLGVLPESPVWLGALSRRDECRRVLEWLRGEEGPCQSEALALEVEACCQGSLLAPADDDTPVKQREGLYEALASSANLRRRLFCGVGLMAVTALSGSNALNFYAPTIFASAGFTSTSASLFLTGTFGLVKLGAAFGFMFCFVRIKGHRFWLLLCTAVCAVSFAVLAFCVRRLEHQQTAPRGTSTAPATTSTIALLAVYTFAFFFGIGHGPIAWNFCAEIFPPHLSTSCCAITTCAQWVFQIVNAVCTPFLLTLAGWYTWIIFCGVNVVLFGWCAVCVPETRGVAPGVEMERVFEPGPPWWRGTKGDGNHAGDWEREPLLGERGGGI